MNLALSCPVVAWLVVVLFASAAGAQAPSAPRDNGPREPEWKEQTIYVPYSKLREVFETQGRGVFLPYEKFQELWKAARDARPKPPAVKPPVGALITETSNVATVGRDVVRVEARVKLEVLEPGWHKVPLRLSDAAIASATLAGQPARIVAESPHGYALLLERKKGEGEHLELVLEYAKGFTKTPGKNTVEFQAPQAPVSRWQVRVDEPGVRIDIHPLIAATDVPGDAAQPARSEVQAFVGAAPSVRIDWTPRAEGATGLEALASVQAQQQVFIEESVTRTRTQLVYAVSRAELGKLEIDVSAAHRVVNVYDANVRRWSVAQREAEGALPPRQRITVELFEPAKASQSVVVELEQFAQDGAAAVGVPVVEAAGVGRQQGVVVVQVAEGLRAEAARRTGLLQLDAAELPAALARAAWTFAYRYAATPFDLALTVEKVQPRITVDSLVEARLQPQRLLLDVQAVYSIERAGVFRLEYEVPAGFEVLAARRHTLPGVEPAQVDAFRLEGQQSNRLVVNLGRKALGRVGLLIQLARQLKEPDLLAPTGQAAVIPLAVPRAALDGIERATGRLVVYAPESLRVNPSQVEGLRVVSLQEALGAIPSLGGGRGDERPVQAFAFADAPASLSLQAERRKPFVTARQVLVARIEPGVVKSTSTIHYDILYSGLKSVRIDVPADLAPLLRNDTPAVRESVITPPPADLAEGYVAWSLAGESEFLGAVAIRLSWERQLEKLDVGSSVDIALPHLRPRLVDRAWGQIVLAKAEAIDVHEKGEPAGLRPIDPQHDLAPDAGVADGARAFEFYDDWTLTMTATRYALEDVKRTSIERAYVRMVVTRGQQTAVQALYRMRIARQRLAVRLPGEVSFDIEPLRINGQGVLLEKGAAGEYSIPLVGQGPDAPFLLELRYTLAGAATAFNLPEFPEEPAVQKVYLGVFLPEEWAVTAASGPWTEEIYWRWGPADWRYRGGMGLVPWPTRGDAELLQWVREGMSVSGGGVDSFQKDGRQYLFSTLRPAPAPQGTLRLAAAHRTLLNFLVLAALLSAAFAVLRRPAGQRAVGIGMFVTALVLLGVFFPLLAHELFNGVFLAGVLVAAVVWLTSWTWALRPSASGSAAPSSTPPPQPPAVASEPPKPAEPPPGDAPRAEGGEKHG